MDPTVRIEQRERVIDGKQCPFSEVFVMQGGRSFYSRLWHTIDDSPHARAAQAQDFLRRQARPI